MTKLRAWCHQGGPYKGVAVEWCRAAGRGIQNIAAAYSAHARPPSSLNPPTHPPHPRLPCLTPPSTKPCPPPPSCMPCPTSCMWSEPYGGTTVQLCCSAAVHSFATAACTAACTSAVRVYAADECPMLPPGPSSRRKRCAVVPASVLPVPPQLRLPRHQLQVPDGAGAPPLPLIRPPGRCRGG
jgi:hypothetical protein